MESKVETTYGQFFEFDSLLHLSMLKVAKNINDLSFPEAEKRFYLKLLLSVLVLIWCEQIYSRTWKMSCLVLFSCIWLQGSRGWGWINTDLNETLSVWRDTKEHARHLRHYLDLLNTCARVLYLDFKNISFAHFLLVPTGCFADKYVTCTWSWD